MNRYFKHHLLATLLCVAFTAEVRAQTTTFTYQGRLQSDGAAWSGPAEFRFTLWDAVSGGTQLAATTPETLAGTVTDGLFNLPLDFGAEPFPDGADRWLQIAVRPGLGSFTTLTPRQRLTSTPYAITAGNLTGPLPAGQLSGTVPNANLGGTYSGALTLNNAANSYTGNGAGLTSLDASRLTSGTVPDARLAANVARTNLVWLLGGNAGTTTGTHFLGTADNQPVEVKVNGTRALRLEPTANTDTVNVIGGSARNVVGADVVGATIGGGGAGNYFGSPYTNRVDADFGTVSGGRRNTIQTNASSATLGGGRNNTIHANAWYGTIAGGDGNRALAGWTVVAGGLSNTNAGDYSAIGGGFANSIETAVGTGGNAATIAGGWRNSIGAIAQRSTIGGGSQNRIGPGVYLSTISGGVQNTVDGDKGFIGGGEDNLITTNTWWAMIPGGRSNRVSQLYGFAAGNRAQADHPGAFVWADSTASDFASTATNQFNVRASGGARFVTSGAGMTVDGLSVLAGTVPSSGLSGTYSSAVTFNNAANSFSGNGAGLTNVNATSLGGLSSSNFWQIGGNAGTSSGTHFLGTVDNQPLELKVNGLRALRLEDNGDGSDFGTAPDGAPNFVAGSPANVVAAGVVGATVGGGGATNYGSFPQPNAVRADYGTVSGGLNNLIGPGAFAASISGGYDNEISTNSSYAVVGGGEENAVAVSSHAVIGGGYRNNIHPNSGYSIIAGGEENTIATISLWSTIAGGFSNFIGPESYHSSIGGGYDNGAGANAVGSTIAGGAGNFIRPNAEWGAIGGGSGNTITNGAIHATIPGGRENRATDFGFAAGRRAKANHPGAFVWADSTDSDFASTATNQFNVRAGGGARFVTSGAGMTVDGPVRANDGSAASPALTFSADTDTGLFRPSANALALTTGAAERMRITSAGLLGLGTNNPAARLHIASAGATPQLHLGQNDSANAFTRMRYSVGNTNLWDIAAGGNNNVLNFYYIPASNDRMTLDTNGNLFIDGTLNPPSDRNVKQGFAAVDALAVLEKVAALPVQTWAYKHSGEVRHIGPVAQDFHAVFGLGASDTSIATVDADGVALAAIQGLNEKVEVKSQKAEDRMQKLEAENMALKARLEKLERLLANQTAH